MLPPSPSSSPTRPLQEARLCQAMPHSLEAQGGFSHRILTEQARLDLLAQKQLCPPPVFCHWLIDQLVLLRDVPQLVKNPPATQETWVRSLGQENSPGGGHGDPLQYSGQWPQDKLLDFGLPQSFSGKESACNMGDLGSVPGLGRSLWRRERLPTPGFWPGESHGLYHAWDCRELDTTEPLSLHLVLLQVLCSSQFLFICRPLYVSSIASPQKSPLSTVDMH